MCCKGCCNCWREEFRIQNVGLEHENPRTFAESQYGRSIAYVLWRLLTAGYFIGIMIYNGATYSNRLKWFILLTNWTFVVLTLNLIIQAIIATRHYVKSRTWSPDSPMYQSMPWVFKIMWILNNVTIAAAPMICTGFWTAVYQPGWNITIVNVSTHGVNAAYVIIDMFVSGLPVRLLHVFHPMTYFTTYFLFTLAYWQGGGTSERGEPYIYTVIDYGSSPGKAAGGIVWMVFLAAPAFYLAIYGLYKLRLFLVKACCDRMKPDKSSGNQISLA